MSALNSILIPGQPLVLPKGPAPKFGSGIYLKDGKARASLIGVPKNEGGTISLSQQRPHPPAPSSVVLGTITRLSPQQALISITVIDGIPLPHGEEFTGVIRSQDVRATEKDKVKLAECFRGGDVVRALVISLGDAKSYFLTTARNDLGVVFATSEAGKEMLWRFKECNTRADIMARDEMSEDRKD